MDKSTYESVIDLTQALVRIKSENPGNGENAVQDFLRQIFTAHGIPTNTVKTKHGRETLLARIKGSSDGPGLVLSGHADVVPVSLEEQAEWTYRPFEAIIQNGRLYGRGSSDMKGGLAAGLVAFCKIAKQAIMPCVDLVFISTADEEYGMTGVRSLVGHAWLRSISHALVMEPTDLQIAKTGNGRTFGRITCKGEKAHGAIKSAGQNAILLMNDLIRRIMAIDLGRVIGAPGSFWQPISISAGLEPGIVPDRCTMLIDARLTWPADPHAVWTYLSTLFENMPVTIEPLDLRRTWQASPNDRLYLILKQALKKNSIATQAVHFPGSTDGNIFLESGIQPLICGPGRLALAHRANEYVELDALEKASSVYFSVLSDWAANPRAFDTRVL